jgi:choline dehydrogenase-like flavoprotein
VIISAGAMQSPHLLMVSGIGPKETLQRFGIPVIVDAPGVGQGLEVSQMVDLCSERMLNQYRTIQL